MNTALTSPITIATTGATGIGTVLDLPDGLIATWSANLIRISGTPTNTGTFTYKIYLTGGCGTASATGTITVNATVPGPPTNVVATAGNTSAEVKFVAPTNNGGSPILNYTVTAIPGGGTSGGSTGSGTGAGGATGGPTGNSTPLTVTGQNSPLTVTGLTNGTSYTFTVVATNGVGSSGPSDTSSAVTPATAPDAPTGVVATAGNGSASVAFVAPTTNGGSAIVEYLVTSNPATSLVKGTSSPINVTGLTNGTSYSFKVQAVNGVDTSASSGPSTAVTPNASACQTTSITYKGLGYKTVGIGTQCWMAENLRTSEYNDGTNIPNKSSSHSSEWIGLTTGARAVYYTILYQTYGDDYGYLYNWYAVDSKKLCPTGWHVPTDSDWNKLVKYLDSDADTTFTSSTQSFTAGTKLKKNDALWTTNTGTDDSGFSALPGGYRGIDGSFDGISYDAFFWSATEYDNSIAWGLLLTSFNGNVDRYYDSKSVGASVRCLRD